jgi:hypothetical protein
VEAQRSAKAVRASAKWKPAWKWKISLDAEALARKRWKPVEKAAAKREEIGRKLVEARARVAELTSAHPAAEERDREARGLALAEGKPAPLSEAKKIERELEEARSLVQDLDAAAAVVQRQFQEVLDANRESWLSGSRAGDRAGKERRSLRLGSIRAGSRKARGGAGLACLARARPR